MLYQSLANFFRDIPSKYILLLILIFGFLLRINNLTIGSPVINVSNDEAIYLLSALNMIASKTPFTIGNYGPLGAYIQLPFLALASAVLVLTGKVHGLGGIQFLLITQPGYMLFIPRAISAMFGTLSVLAIFGLTKELFGNRRVALWAAFFAAASFNLVHISHLSRPWSPAILFSIVSAIFAVRSIKTNTHKRKNTFLAFVFAAIAFGFHQISGIFIVFVIAIRLLSGGIKSLFSRINLAALFIWGILVFILNWLSLGSYFLETVKPNSPNGSLIDLSGKPNSILGLLNYFISKGSFLKIPQDLILTDGIMVILAFLFFVIRIKQKKLSTVELSFLVFLLFNLLLQVTIFPNFLRYFLIAIGFLPIFAGYTFELILRKIKLKAFVVTLVIVGVSFNSIYWNFLILKEPTFDQVRKWLDSNIGSAIPIASTVSKYFNYIPTENASSLIRKTEPGFYKSAADIVGNTYPYNVRNILYLDYFNGESKSDDLMLGYSAYPVKYVVDSYLRSKDRLLNQDTNFQFKLVAHFSPTGNRIYSDYIPEVLFDPTYNFPLFKVDRAGPYFDVLEISNYSDLTNKK